MVTLESTKLKGNLFSLGNGYYLSKNDPLFWKKLLIQRPEDKEALYYVGLEYEIEARNYLDRYNLTKTDQYLTLYHKLMKQSFELINRSFNKGFLSARLDVLRMERAMKITQSKDLANLEKFVSKNGKTRLLLTLIFGLIMALILAMIFLPRLRTTTNHINNHYLYMLPYEVIEQKPTTLITFPGLKDPAKVIVVKREISKELLVNQLVAGLKADYEMKPVSEAKQVVAIDETNTERGMVFWAGGDKNIQVYIYPQESTAFDTSQERQLWETTTVVRSATYQFSKKNGYLPEDLKTLIQPFPNNYLTELPNDPFELKHTVTLSSTGEGGWLYSLMENPANQDWVAVVKEAIKPNIPYVKEIPFSPITITINKGNHTLLVISGDRIIRKYSVALGKEDSTPEGDFFISKKIMNPDKFVPLDQNVYGTRAMELSNINFAIHGTNLPSSIGQEVSQGCIRLNNSEMEDLYAITPLYTPVKIGKSTTPIQGLPLLDSPNIYLYNRTDNKKEEDNLSVYHWAH
ncbi:L,D-transpeptidase [Desulfosporosinus burensis]